MGYLWGVVIALDQLANALLRGAPDETLSSRAHRMRLKGHRYWGWTAGAINKIFFLEDDHCRASYEREMARKHFPAAMQT